MAGKTIDAVLRLSAQVTEALSGLRQVRKEAADINGTGGNPAQAARQQARAVTEAERQGADQRRALRAQERAERKAATDAELAAARAAAREKLEAERRARREARQAEEDELRKTRKARAQSDRDELADQARLQRQQRNDARKLAQVAPQITDIGTQLAGGQNPLLVAIQQGGQLRDIFGSWRAALQGVTSVLTPVRLAIGGLVGGAALFVAQIIQGHRESETLRRVLALTGNAAGTSLGQISGLAKGIAAETQVSIGVAREAVASVLQLQGQTANTMGATARAVSAIAKLSGESAEQVSKDFADQASGVTEWAIKSNKAYNFLSAAQVDYIRQLEQQGRVQEAIRFTNDQLAQTLVQRTAPALGTLERAWAAVKNTVSGFLDQLKEIGRDATPEQRLERLQKKLDEIANRQAQPLFAGRRRSTDAAEVDGIRQEQGTLLRDQARNAERALAQQAEQQKIEEQGIERQSALAAQSIAVTQQKVAAELRLLTQRQSAIESLDARGLISERAKALALNQIEQGRIKQQEILQKEQIEAAERIAKAEKSQTAKIQADARVTEAKAALTTTRAQLAAAVAEAQRIIDADALEKSRERARAYAEVWQKAADQVRGYARDNALAAAAQLPDAQGRAGAEARINTADLQRQLDRTVLELNVAIGLAIDPNQRAELQRQLQALLTEGQAAIDQATRSATLKSLQGQGGEQLERLRLAEEAIRQAVEQRVITSEEGERRIFAAREQAIPQLLELLALQKALAQTAAERNAIEQLELRIRGLSDSTTELQRTLAAQATSGLASFFTAVGRDIRKTDRALGDFLRNFLGSWQEILNRRLAEKLINQAIDALSGFKVQGGGASGGILGALVSFLGGLFSSGSGVSFQGVGAAPYHTGGIVGRDGGAMRRLAPWVFEGAQVLHSGGLAGLSTNEVPAVLMKGEEVLTTDDPRHRANLRSGAGGPLVGNLTVTVTTDSTGSGASDQQMGNRLAALVRVAIERELANQMRPGGMLQHVAR